MMKAFKSQLAAKQAMTKAERAYTDARCEANGAYGRAMQDPSIADPHAYDKASKARASAAYDRMQAIYDQARIQGFWVKSWWCGPNATRDLVAANMD